MNLESFNKKYSGICFVIAAGPSLKGLDLSFLNKYYSFVVNSGYLAYKDANFFVSDDWSIANWSWMNDLKINKTITCLLYENKLKEHQNKFVKQAVLFRHRQGYHITDIYEHENPSNHICQARTSVGSAIHIAHIMGFNEIVLLGVDCYRENNQRYFWSSNTNKPYRTDSLPTDSYIKTINKGRQTDKDLLDILRYWELRGNEFLKKVKVYNSSKNSMVTVFPKVDLEKYK